LYPQSNLATPFDSMSTPNMNNESKQLHVDITDVFKCSIATFTYIPIVH